MTAHRNSVQRIKLSDGTEYHMHGLVGTQHERVVIRRGEGGWTAQSSWSTNVDLRGHTATELINAVDAVMSPVGRRRDSQRSRVYSAEDVVNSARDFATHDEVVEFVRQVEASDVWKRIVPMPRKSTVDVVEGPSWQSSSARWGKWEIKISAARYHRTRQIVIHELAHLATHMVDQNAASHGPEFCGVYLELLEELGNPEAAADLRLAFEMKNVKVKELVK